MLDEVVYNGSVYVRPIRKRLLQYLGGSKTGNTLKQDLIETRLTPIDKVFTYIKELTIYAFEDDTLEYQLIKVAGLEIINETGKALPLVK